MLRWSEYSIHGQLLLWLMIPSVFITVSTLIYTSGKMSQTTEGVFDEALVNSADSITSRMVGKGDHVVVSIPNYTREVIEHHYADIFYFQIRDLKGQLLTEDHGIRTPFRDVTGNEAVFSDGIVDGEPVRQACFEVQSEELHRPVIIEVAETRRTRDDFIRGMIINGVINRFLIILVTACCVWVGIGRGLKPLDDLRNRIAARLPQDLQPISLKGIPREMVPMVSTINDLLERLRQEINAQKEFIANAAHQLRTPLAGLKTYIGYSRRLAKDSQPEIQEALCQLDVGADRLTRMVNRLLLLAQTEPQARATGDFCEIDLNEVMSDAVLEVRPAAANKGIELVLQTSSQPALVLGNFEQLRELAINLVENATIYTQSKGQVKVSVSRKEDGKAQFLVQDNGPGIPPEERGKVFERFYRVLGNENAGSGLGLAIVAQIASLHDAGVELSEGLNNSGLTVIVEFPAVRSRQAKDSAAPAIS